MVVLMGQPEALAGPFFARNVVTAAMSGWNPQLLDRHAMVVSSLDILKS